MVLTRSRANSASRNMQQPGSAMPSGDDELFVDVRTSTPPLAGPPSASASAVSPQPLPGREQHDFAHTAQPGQAPPGAIHQFQSTAAPIVMTDQQLVFLLQSLRSQPPAQGASPPLTTVSTNLSKCTARYNGVGDVLAFIDSVQIYKDCVSVSDDIALRGLPMLFTDFAATWWQGVKHSVSSWQEAIDLLRQTFGPRLPPHRIYREIFSKEQGEERTDVFVCRVRALIAQLPPNTLPENPVQLDMVYGLLNKRIREKVVRTAFTSFAELLQQARVVEDVLEEGSTTAPTGKYSSTFSYPPPFVAQTSTSSSASVVKPEKSSQSKPRPRCSFCKMFGHVKDDCRKLKNKSTMEPVKSEPAAAQPELRPSLTCFGCGAPGVIRSNCKTCKEKHSALPSMTTTAFQSVSVCETVLNPRRRPIFKIVVFGAIGTALLDTGAKQSVASDSLTRHLRSNGQVFNSIETELRFADGSHRVQLVETALVNVKVHGKELKTLFMVLPGARDSLLGMNFIADAGMVLDFDNNRFSLRSTGFHELEYENDDNHVAASAAVGLREDEGVLLSRAEKGKLVELLENNEDIFSVGGGLTPFAVHRIDTADAAPISTPPYRVTPAKKEIIRRRTEIDKVLEPDPSKIQAIVEQENYVPQITPYLKDSVKHLQEVKWRVERQQDLRKDAADENRRSGPTYQEGDLVLVESHRLSQAAKGFTSKFAPRREGPYRISKVISPTTYEVVDKEDVPRGKYHASHLTPYVGDQGIIIHGRRKGRPRKTQDPKPSPVPSADLEGEDITPPIGSSPRPSRTKRAPRRLQD